MHQNARNWLGADQAQRPATGCQATSRKFKCFRMRGKRAGHTVRCCWVVCTWLDDNGLVLPPSLAPDLKNAQALCKQLKKRGFVNSQTIEKNENGLVRVSVRRNI